MEWASAYLSEVSEETESRNKNILMTLFLTGDLKELPEEEILKVATMQ